VNPVAEIPQATIRWSARNHLKVSKEGIPGALQPLYMVKDADPEGFCTYPPVARFSSDAAWADSAKTDTRVLMVSHCIFCVLS